MSITPEELKWVADRMGIYDIKYQEIYNELFDHILSAVEAKRVEGDTRNIQILFQEVVDEHFGGYQGIEAVAKSHEKAYHNKVKYLIWANYKHYINLKTFGLLAAAIIAGNFLPPHKVIVAVLVSAIVVVAGLPLISAYIGLKKIKPAKGKTSLVKNYIVLMASLPVTLFNCVVFLPRLFSDDENINLLSKLPPAVLMLLFGIALIYSFSVNPALQARGKGRYTYQLISA